MASTEALLKTYGLKITESRILILEAFSKAKRPESAQDIHARVTGIDLVTTYRTLASFEKVGLIKRIDLRQDSITYELADDHHHHIVCTACGTVEDFELCDIDDLVGKIVKKASLFKKIQEHNLELYGICNSCVKA